MISATTKIGDAQLKPAAVTGVVCGQKHQKKAQEPYATAAMLMGMPQCPRVNLEGGRVSGCLILRQRTCDGCVLA